MTKISAGGGVFNGLATRRVAFGALAFAGVFGAATLGTSVFGTGTSGNVQLNTEVSTSIAMKIASPNDTNPDCTPESGVTYGTANRYATSNGAEGSKQVDTFDGTIGGADEINNNTSCATLTMSPNTFSSTYSDITVYTNSPNGYALSVRSADNTSPDLVNTTNYTGTDEQHPYTISAGVLTEQDSTTTDDTTGETTTTKIIPGGQNKWAIKTDENGILDTWTAVTSLDQILRAYDTETSGGSQTRVTYGISAGSNPTGKYTTTLTYTATMFDGDNPYVAKLGVTSDEYINVSADTLSIPYRKSANLTVTPVSGYYLSSFTCPEGFTCTGINTGADYTGPQTLTITNEGSTNTGTLSFGGTIADPWACPVATKDSPCVVNGVEYIRLADGHLWTKSSQGSGTWANVKDGQKCPSGTFMPSRYSFDTSKYSGSGLYSATGWSGTYWSSTKYDSSGAYALSVNSSSARIAPYSKTGSHDVVCYR